MKFFWAVAGAVLLASPAWSFAGTTAGCGQALAVPLHARETLRIDSRPAGLEIVGTDAEMLRVTCTADDANGARRISMRASETPGVADLAITGDYGQHNNLKIRVEVPRRTSVQVRMKAGEVDVDGVEGNKDIELTAGQITVRGVHPGDYKRVDASVDIGEVKAPAWGADKGGFFRNFTKSTTDGEYVLRAYVMTGEIDLVGSSRTAD